MLSKSFSKKMLTGAVCVLGLALATTGCKKKQEEKPTITEELTSYAEEQLLLEQIYDNSDRIVDRAFTMGASAIGSCVRITNEPSDNPEMSRMIIDFSNINCLCYDGRYRSGKIVVEYAKDVRRIDAGFYSKVIFQDYKFNDVKVDGNRQIWNRGGNESGNIAYDIISVDAITLKDGKVITGTSERRREWTKGLSTLTTNDDEYLITGKGNFINADRVEYYVQIARPLVDAWNCNWINKGVINIFPTGYSQRSLDFGEGQCESDATINVNGVVRQVSIP